MTLALTVLGCSGSYAAAGGACSGYLLDDGTTRLWLDCGPGTLGNLQRHLPLTGLDALVVTHNHPDHWLELPVVRTALRYYIDRPPLPLLAPAEAMHVAEMIVGPLDPPFAPRVVGDGDTVEVGSMRLRFARTDHPVETLAVRVDAGGVVLAYSSDTGPAFDLGALGDGIQVLLAEATLEAPAADHVHISGEEAGALAAAAGVQRLLVTHVPPGVDPAARVAAAATTFDGPIEAVAVNERYQL